VARNDATAAYWYRAGAKGGDKNAMVALGLLYAAGRGVKQDWSAGARWWTEAAAAGVPIASRFLGDAYACGLGVERDPERAMSEYRRAAKKGEMSSNVQLGHMYRAGCAQAPDEEAMATAYQKAADEGDPEAQVALSGLFFEGRGVEQIFYRAYFWARLAERRLPPGELRASAHAHAARAARLMSAFELQDAEKFIESVVSAGSTPIR
jgi:TPR repeat protein